MTTVVTARLRMVDGIAVLDHDGGGCAPATRAEQQAMARIAELEALQRDLLEALEWYVANDDPTSGPYYRAGFERAQAAIAKARGTGEFSTS